MTGLRTPGGNNDTGGQGMASKDNGDAERIRREAEREAQRRRDDDLRRYAAEKAEQVKRREIERQAREAEERRRRREEGK